MPVKSAQDVQRSESAAAPTTPPLVHPLPSEITDVLRKIVAAHKTYTFAQACRCDLCQALLAARELLTRLDAAPPALHSDWMGLAARAAQEPVTAAYITTVEARAAAYIATAEALASEATPTLPSPQNTPAAPPCPPGALPEPSRLLPGDTVFLEAPPPVFTDARGCRCASCAVEAGTLRDSRLVLLRILDAQPGGKTLYLCHWCFGQTQSWSG
jgi:hypothetical protein